MKLLLSYCAKVNIATHNGTTALHVAAAQGHAQLVQMLLKAGAKPMKLDSIGNSPIMLACLHGQEAAVECLLDAHVDINTGAYSMLVGST